MTRLLLLLTLSFPVFAASLGPEIALTPADVAPAANIQSEPDMATQFGMPAVIWLDSRGSVTGNGGYPALYATTLTSDGTPIPTYGRKIADSVYAAKIVPSGSRDLLIVYATPASPEGTVIAARSMYTSLDFSERVVIGSGTVIDLASAINSSCAILADSGQTHFTAVILNDRSEVLHTLPLSHRVDELTRIGSMDYLATGIEQICDGVNPCTSNVVATKISVSSLGASTSTKVIKSALPYLTRTGVAYNENNALIAWISEEAGERFVEYALVDPQLNFKSNVVRVHTQTQLAYTGHNFKPSVAALSEFVIGFPVPVDAQETAHHLEVVPVTRSGELVEHTPITLGEALSFVYTFWTEGFMPPAGGWFFGTAERGNIVVRRTGTWSGLRSAETNSIALSSSLQSDARIAVSGSTALTIWTESDSPSRIAGSVHSPGISLPPQEIFIGQGGDRRYAPSIASAGDTFLAVWCEEEASSSRVVARRFTLSGVSVHAQPIVLAESVARKHETAVASDGTGFFVVWSEQDGTVHGRRVRVDGSLEAPIQLSSEANFHTRMSLRVVWSGEMFIAAWLFDGWNPIILAPPPPPRMIVRTARVTRTGTLLDVSTNPTIVDTPGESSGIDLAANGTRVLVTWIRHDERCVYATLLTRDGFVSSSSAIACDLEPSSDRGDLAAAWDGRSFVAAWTLGGPVRAIRVTGNATAFEAFELSQPSAAWSPSLARFGDGTIAAYTRATPDLSHGGVGRVFARTIAAEPPPSNGRTRSVRP